MEKILSFRWMHQNFYFGQPRQTGANSHAWGIYHGCQIWTVLQECYGTLAEGTVCSTISHVVQAFQEKGRSNPTKDSDHKLSLLLSRQFRAFQNDNPKEKQQKALPFSVFNKLAEQ
jgi:hypothetical protein